MVQDKPSGSSGLSRSELVLEPRVSARRRKCKLVIVKYNKLMFSQTHHSRPCNAGQVGQTKVKMANEGKS